jgi:hypothetical protein
VDRSEPARNGDAALRRIRPRADYTEAERRFSTILQERFQEMLQGKRNHLEVLRRYPGDEDRIGIIAMPPEVPREQLRLPVVEQLSWQVVRFIHAEAMGGPIAQSVAPDGSTVEVQTFPTKYPHIVIERTDRYVEDDPQPVEITWTLHRVQNQRAQTQVNRLLDATNLAIGLIRSIL